MRDLHPTADQQSTANGQQPGMAAGPSRSNGTPLSGRERVLRVLEGGVPDRPPLHLSFRAAGDRSVPAWARDWPIRAGVDVIEVEIEAEWPVVKAGPDDACPALLDASWPDPADPSLYRTLERLARTHPDRGVFARVPGIFCQIERSLGFATFLQAVEKDSGFAGLIMERFVTLGATMVAEAVARGALALLLVEPLVTSSGDLATRMDHLEQWVFPFDQLLLGSVVREGVALVVECPRVHEGLWEWFRGLGARMIGPLRAADLQQLAENRGGRWKEPALYAALDSNVIARGTPDEIREHVRATCALAGPNRGLLLSATDVPPGTPMGSLEALLEAVDDCRY